METVPFAGSGPNPLVRQKIPTLHHPEGIDPEAMFFDEARVHNLILEYQRSPSLKLGRLLFWLACR
jgi:hypothetical protein